MTRGGGSRRFFVGLVGINALLILINFGTGAVSARALGPEGRGQLAAAVILFGIAGVGLTGGVPQAVVVWRKSLTPILPGLSIHLGLSFGVAVALAVVLGLHQLTWLTAPGILGAIGLSVGAVCAACATGLAQRLGLLGGQLHVIRMAPAALTLSGMSLLWAVGVRDANIWILASGLSLLIPSAFIYFSLVVRSRFDDIPSDPADPKLAAFVTLAASSLMVTIGSQVVYRIDSIAIALRLPDSSVGLYAVAYGVSAASFSLASAAGVIGFSELRRAEPKQRGLVVRRSLVRSAVVSGAVAVAITVAAPVLVPLVYGEAFIGAIPVMQVLVWGSLPMTLDFVLVHSLLSLSQARRVLVTQATVVVGAACALSLALRTGDLVLIACIPVLVYSCSAVLMMIHTWRALR